MRIKKKKLLVFASTFPRKVYKYQEIINISSLRTVTIFPGDRKVAGCFNYSGGNL